jgi:cell wall-associated NlpC family hydrolase
MDRVTLLLTCKSVISVLLVFGGIFALVIGYKLYLKGIGIISDGSRIEINNAKASLKTVGSVVMVTSVAWGGFGYLASPKYLWRKESVTVSSFGNHSPLINGNNVKSKIGNDSHSDKYSVNTVKVNRKDNPKISVKDSVASNSLNSCPNNVSTLKSDGMKSKATAGSHEELNTTNCVRKRQRRTDIEKLPILKQRLNEELFNEKDYEQSLAELTEADSNRKVDKSKNLELKSDNVNKLKDKAYGFLGTHYRFGGNSVWGIDCSAFVQQVFRHMEVSLPRTAREQYQAGIEINPDELQRGDLVFFRTYAKDPSHVGIYIGNGYFIHVSSRDHRYIVSPLKSTYYSSRFVGAKRVANINRIDSRLKYLELEPNVETAEQAPQNDALGVYIIPKVP